MGGYILGKSDYDSITKLKNISSSMASLYQKLYDLEISGNKDSLEYKELIILLKESILKEKEVYKDLNFSSEKCDAWLDYLNGIQDSGKMLFGSISEFDCIKRISSRVSRIGNNLLYKSILKAFSINSDMFDEFVDVNDEINLAFNMDFAASYLYFLNYFINNNNYVKYRSSLIKTKYELAFLRLDLDKGLSNSNFESPESLYIASKMMGDLYGLPNYIYMELKNMMASINFWEYADILLEINDNNYSSDYYNVCSIMCQAFIKASLVLLDADGIKELSSEYNEELLSSDYRKKHLNHRISESIIMQCLQNAKYDREKVSYLSLRKEK